MARRRRKSTKVKRPIELEGESDEPGGETLAVLIDAEYFRTKREWTGVVEAKQQLIDRAVTKKERTVVCVSDAGNYRRYQKTLKNCELIDLNENEYKFRHES